MDKFTENQIEMMRQDLETNFEVSRFIENTKKLFQRQGRNFDKEFNEWKKTKEK